MFLRLFSISFFLTLSLHAQSISLNANQWYLLGTSTDTSISSFTLQEGDTLWKYSNSTWQYYKEGYTLDIGLDEISTLTAGEGFWIKPNSDISLTLLDEQGTPPTLKAGWNLLSSVSDINLTQMYTDKQTPYAWSYEDSDWKLWRFDGDKEFETLNQHQGYWLYNLASQVNIGTKQTTLSNGAFETVTHSSSNSVEDIWNISFDIVPQNVDSFNIGIKFIKDTGAYGEFVYSSLSLTDGVLSSPGFLFVEGYNSLGEGGSSTFSSTYDPNNLRSSSISLVNNTLYLNLGTIMANQSLAPASTFTKISDYNITIVIESLSIDGGVTQSLEDLTLYNVDINGSGISGDIKIQ